MDRDDTTEGIENTKENAASYFHPLPGCAFPNSSLARHCRRKQIRVRYREATRLYGGIRDKIGS